MLGLPIIDDMLNGGNYTDNGDGITGAEQAKKGFGSKLTDLLGKGKAAISDIIPGGNGKPLFTTGFDVSFDPKNIALIAVIAIACMWIIKKLT